MLSDYEGAKNLNNGVRVVARIPRGHTKTSIVSDPNYEQFCLQATKQFGFTQRSVYGPARLTAEAGLKQLEGMSGDEAYDWPLDRTLRVEEEIYKMLSAWGCEYHFLTWKEVFEGNGDLNKFVYDTSCGYGFGKLARTKATFFSKYPEFSKKCLLTDWEHLAPDQTPIIWTKKASTKDELRDVDRILAYEGIGKTRLFDGAPWIYTCQERKMFGEFASKFYAAGRSFKFFSIVGADVFHGAWNRFIRALTRQCQIFNIQAADVNKWDKLYMFMFYHLDAELLERLCLEVDYISRSKIRTHTERCQISHTAFTLAGVLLTKKCGMDSGKVLTIVLNCLGQLRVIYHKWLAVMPFEYHGWEKLMDFLRLYVVGDDSVVNPMVDDVFTIRVIVDAYKQFGWIAEPERYPGKDNVHQFMFAGRRTFWCEEAQQYWPYLPKDRILAINEFSKTKSTSETRYQRAYASCILSFPYLFFEEHEDQEVFVIAWAYYQHLTRSRVLVGLPTSGNILTDLWFLYTGRPLLTSSWLQSKYNRSKMMFLAKAPTENVKIFETSQETGICLKQGSSAS